MRGLRNPVGDEEPRVYWVRRAVVLVAAAVVIVVIWLVIRGLTGGEGESKTPSTTTSPQPGVTNSAGANSAAPNDPSRPCTAEDVLVTAVASPTQVNAGSEAAFEVGVEHVGTAACKLSTTADGSALRVRSGDDVYYDSAWCEGPVFAEGEWILQPGDREALQATWSSYRYNDSCEPVDSPAPAGHYRAAVSVAGIAAAESAFELVS
ncbi:hypothetical protein [Demequina sp.]|uniref:hypothetical protein n=1 Tax=Demequina sp. TaxID=2050685 RepID=UPI003A839F7A